MRNAFLSTVPGRPPFCTPKTSSRPPPTCPASPRDRLSCSPSRECPGVGLPVGTRGLPRLGGGDLLPGGSRWSAEVSKHEKSPSSGPMGHGKGRISQQRPHWTSGEKNTIPSHQALWLLTLLANTKQPWGDHGGGYGSDDRSTSQPLSNALQNNRRNTPFTGSPELVILSQSNRCLCGHLRSYISHEFCKLQMALGTLGLYLLATFLASCALFSVLKTLGKPL